MHTLGVHDLAPAEAGLVRALLRLTAQSEPAPGWTFTAEGPCDALLVDAASTAPAAQLLARAPHVCLLGTTGRTDFPSLPRPLQADALTAWLGKLPVQAATRVETPLIAVPAAAEVRYRLLRWPPQALLHGDTARVRMATMLSRKPLSMRELSVLSGQPEARCVVFLHLLQGFSLIEQVVPEPARAVPVPRHAPPPSSLLKVVRGLRARLGLVH